MLGLLLRDGAAGEGCPRGWRTHPRPPDTHSTRQYGLSNFLLWEAPGEGEARGMGGQAEDVPLQRPPAAPGPDPLVESP